MRTFLLISAICGLSCFLPCCNPAKEEAVNPQKEEDQIFRPNFSLEKKVELSSEKVNAKDVLARLNSNGEVVYLRPEKAYENLIKKQLMLANPGQSPSDILIKDEVIEKTQENGYYYLFATVERDDQLSVAALLLETFTPKHGEDVFIAVGGGNVTHSCSGDGCKLCVLKKNSLGKITGCECDSGLIGGYCNHTVTETVDSDL